MATHKDALKDFDKVKKKILEIVITRAYENTSKKFRAAADAGEADTLNKMFPKPVSLIHKLSSKGIIHKIRHPDVLVD